MHLNRYFEGRTATYAVLIVLVALTRLLPHPMNFTPVGALGLFAGAYARRKEAWIIPVAALFISDLFIGFYEPLVMLFVYGGFALCALIGRYLLSQKRSVVRIGGAAFASATVFFILSNFGLWATGLYYPLTLEGLIQCYVLAIPFFGNTLLGDLFYAATLFGIYEAAGVWLTKQPGVRAT